MKYTDPPPRGDDIPKRLSDWLDRVWRGRFKSLIADDVSIVEITSGQLLTTDIDKKIVTSGSVISWLLGTTNQITVTDNEDGTLTLSTPQNTDTDADVEFDSATLDDLTASKMLSADANKKIISISDLTAWIAGTENEIEVTSDGDGTITISFSDSISFSGLDLTGITDGNMPYMSASGFADSSVRFNGSSIAIGTSTNYTEIKSDGEINLHGTARVKKELDFNAGAVKAPGTNGAGWVAHGIKGAWEFANNKDERIVTAINFPKDMDLSVAPVLKVCWSSNATEEDAVWQLEYLFRKEGEDTTDAAQETLSLVAASSATADGFTCTDFTGVDVPHADDRTMFLRLTRVSSDGSDTLGTTAELHSIIFVYTSNKLGEAL